MSLYNQLVNLNLFIKAANVTKLNTYCYLVKKFNSLCCTVWKDVYKFDLKYCVQVVLHNCDHN